MDLEKEDEKLRNEYPENRMIAERIVQLVVGVPLLLAEKLCGVFLDVDDKFFEFREELDNKEDEIKKN